MSATKHSVDMGCGEQGTVLRHCLWASVMSVSVTEYLVVGIESGQLYCFRRTF